MAAPHRFLRLAGSAPLPARLRGAAVAIGNFDGVHLGHLDVLQTALREARQSGRPALAFTFEPHPRTVFNPQAPVYRLTDAEQKADYFRRLGFDGVIEQAFTADFARISAEDFVRSVLAEKLGASCIIAGVNFHFGHKRQGTPAFLRRAGRDFGFKTLLTDGHRSADGEIISSSRIRRLLENGAAAEANALLGHYYAARGEIIRGRALGRQLGFPTANMALPAETKLKFGIYAVYFRLGGRLYPGVASFGRRPTVETEGAPLLETFIFGFEQDIYGKRAEALFAGFLRGEEKFADTEALIAQMRRDAAAAKALLAVNPADKWGVFAG